MLINDDYRFSFVHIPKCAGTSVRQQLLRYDQRESHYSVIYPNSSSMPEVFDLPNFGPVKYNHLNLRALKTVLPAELNRVVEYRSLAIIRDPHMRFISSLSERIKILRHTSIALQTKSEIRKEIALVLDELPKHADTNDVYPLGLVTFQRQVDFIFLNNICALSRLYRIEKIPAFFEDAFSTLDVAESPQRAADTKANTTRAFRSSRLRGIEGRSGKLLQVVRHVIPESVRSSISAKLKQSGSESMEWILNEPRVLSFIESFYADDLKLWRASNHTTIERGTPLAAL